MWTNSKNASSISRFLTRWLCKLEKSRFKPWLECPYSKNRTSIFREDWYTVECKQYIEQSHSADPTSMAERTLYRLTWAHGCRVQTCRSCSTRRFPSPRSSCTPSSCSSAPAPHTTYLWLFLSVLRGKCISDIYNLFNNIFIRLNKKLQVTELVILFSLNF